jgi:ssDNA thymidine ADP-ribosyltransferase DarT-like protein
VRIEEISELHYITPLKNVPSILQRGILSHNRAAKLKHNDISMREIQDVRANKRVPGGLPLHDYANLYFNGRNKMMAKKRPEHDRLCVLRVSTEALNIPDAVIADQNASSKYALFLPSPLGLQKLQHDEIFVRSWKCPDDQIREWRLGSFVCAELLVPHVVAPKLILGAYVLDGVVRTRFTELEPKLECVVNADIFLR